MENRLFGTDGVRGVANTEITPSLAFDLGKAGALLLKNNNNDTFLIGRDTRISGDMLSNSLIAGILSVGCNVIDVGVVPTPAIAYLLKKLNLTAGVMISASHNPFNFNGIKFFDSQGLKLSDTTEDSIQELIESRFSNIEPKTGSDIGTLSLQRNLIDLYSDFIKSTIDISLSGLKIALDCGNGATYSIAEDIFSKLQANIIAINTNPNGVNINDNCGSTHLESLKHCVIENNCDFGIAFDGDGDRCLAVDHTGRTINGDKILAICSTFMKKDGVLKGNAFVGTVMSNLGLNIYAKENNLTLVQSKVGDRYVLEEMLKHNYNLGGEESGHIIFSDFNSTGDGLLTAIQLSSFVKRSKERLEDLGNIMDEFPQKLINIHVENSAKQKILSNEHVIAAISHEEKLLNGKGRILLRASGTEPLVRIMVEGPSDSLINSIATNIATIINRIK